MFERHLWGWGYGKDKPKARYIITTPCLPIRNSGCLKQIRTFRQALLLSGCIIKWPWMQVINLSGRKCPLTQQHYLRGPSKTKDGKDPCFSTTQWSFLWLSCYKGNFFSEGKTLRLESGHLLFSPESLMESLWPQPMLQATVAPPVKMEVVYGF